MWSLYLTWSLGVGEPFPKSWGLYAPVFWVRHMLPLRSYNLSTLFTSLLYILCVEEARPEILGRGTSGLVGKYIECQMLGGLPQ